MNSVKYIKFENAAGDENISVVVDGILHGARDDHPNWDMIVALAEADDPSVIDYFKVANAISKRFEELTTRISIRDDKIHWDGEPVHNTLTQKILALMDERVEDWRPFVAFMENLYANPNEHSRKVAYDYLMDNGFTITPEGNILTYKGVSEGFLSSQSGMAFVDEKLMTGQIHYPVGSTVTMPRDLVNHDPYAPCHIGLHVATFDFARGFSSQVIECEVNPRDIVNVPCEGSKKMRVCRLNVLRVVAEPNKAAYSTPEKAPAKKATKPRLPKTDEPIKFKRVKPDELAEMQARAKRRKQNFIKYATKVGGWQLQPGRDGSKGAHWKRPR